MFRNLQTNPEILPAAWYTLAIPGEGGGTALWDFALKDKIVQGGFPFRVWTIISAILELFLLKNLQVITLK